MKIDLKPPYSEKWKVGYLIKGPDGRHRVFLSNGKLDRSGTSYARYLMTVHLGRYLVKDEHVDHIDDDKTNDVIENLQILSQAENNLKARNKKLRDEGLDSFWCIVECAECEKAFSIRSKKLIRAGFGVRPVCCSKSCSGKFQARTMKNCLPGGYNKIKVSEEQHLMIIELRSESISDYKISDITGLSRVKISRYRKEHGIA